MKKYMDKLNAKIKINKNLFTFMLSITIIGLTAGALFTAILSTNDKQLVIEYLNTFLATVNTNKLDYTNSLINSLILSPGLAIIVWLLGISVIGFVLVIVILFLKAFTLGFTISSIITTYKLKGLIYAFIYAFPHLIINILVFILLGAFALIMSFKIIHSITVKKAIDLKHYMNKYFTILILAITVLIITSLYEIYIMPKILTLLIN